VLFVKKRSRTPKEVFVLRFVTVVRHDKGFGVLWQNWFRGKKQNSTLRIPTACIHDKEPE